MLVSPEQEYHWLVLKISEVQKFEQWELGCNLEPFQFHPQSFLLLEVFGFFIWRRNKGGGRSGLLPLRLLPPRPSPKRKKIDGWMYLHYLGNIFSELFDHLFLGSSSLLIILFFILMSVFHCSHLHTVHNLPVKLSNLILLSEQLIFCSL